MPTWGPRAISQPCRHRFEQMPMGALSLLVGFLVVELATVLPCVVFLQSCLCPQRAR